VTTNSDMETHGLTAERLKARKERREAWAKEHPELAEKMAAHRKMLENKIEHHKKGMESHKASGDDSSGQ
jgi:hypothetical protein